VILAHLADLHLGFRAFGSSRSGKNIRELDVARAFLVATEELVRLRPDLILVAGDVFHSWAPPPSALVTFARGLRTLAGALPDTPVLTIAGAHDTPFRPGETGAIAAFDALPTVHVAFRAVREVHVRDQDVRVVMVPHGARRSEAEVVLSPDTACSVNLLLSRVRIDSRDASKEWESVHLEEWDYVALGGPHQYTRVGERAIVAGSLERIGLDPWAEMAFDKGFVTFDLENGTTRFHPIPGRPVVELAPIRAERADPATVSRRIKEAIAAVPGGVDEKMVRLRIGGLPPDRWSVLEEEVLRKLRYRAVHVRVESAGEGDSGEAGDELSVTSRPSLSNRVRARLSAETLSAVDGILARELEEVEVAGGRPSGRAGREVKGSLNLLVLDAATARGKVARALLEGVLDAQFPQLLDVSEPSREGSGSHRRGEVGVAGERVVVEGVSAGHLEALLERGSRLLADLRGAAGGRSAALRLSGGSGSSAPDESMAMEGREGEAPFGAGRGESDLEQLQCRLAGLRADAAEASGDVAFRTMEWLRERQDAETHLQAYRDRARELRDGLRNLEEGGATAECPTCGRALSERFEGVVSELRDEWEAVVQDGKWWKKRREQLELKPEELQELEGRSVRLHAEMERCSEELERERLRLEEGVLKKEQAAAEMPNGPPDRTAAPPLGMAIHALEAVAGDLEREARSELLAASGTLLSRITGGRRWGLVLRDGRVELPGSEAREGTDEDQVDRWAAYLCLRLALARAVHREGLRVPGLVLARELDQIDEDTRAGSIPLLRSLLPEVGDVWVLTDGTVMESQPEVWDAVFEIQTPPMKEGLEVRRLSQVVPVVRPIPVVKGA
jgi:DNA repair exonuclease SbcCD nuclease subunit